MKLPKTLLTKLPILVTLIAVIGLSLGMISQASTSASHNDSASAPNSSVKQPKSLKASSVLDTYTGATDAFSAAAATFSSTIIQSTITPSAWADSTSDTAGPYTQPNQPLNTSTSPKQQPTPVNPCTSCLDTGDPSDECLSYCTSSPIPVSGGCGPCNNAPTGAGPRVQRLCPMMDCAL